MEQAARHLERSARASSPSARSGSRRPAKPARVVAPDRRGDAVRGAGVGDGRPRHELEVGAEAERPRGVAQVGEGIGEARLVAVVADDEDVMRAQPRADLEQRQQRISGEVGADAHDLEVEHADAGVVDGRQRLRAAGGRSSISAVGGGRCRSGRQQSQADRLRSRNAPRAAPSPGGGQAQRRQRGEREDSGPCGRMARGTTRNDSYLDGLPGHARVNPDDPSESMAVLCIRNAVETTPLASAPGLARLAICVPDLAERASTAPSSTRSAAARSRARRAPAAGRHRGAARGLAPAGAAGAAPAQEGRPRHRCARPRRRRRAARPRR